MCTTRSHWPSHTFSHDFSIHRPYDAKLKWRQRAINRTDAWAEIFFFLEFCFITPHNTTIRYDCEYKMKCFCVSSGRCGVVWQDDGPTKWNKFITKNIVICNDWCEAQFVSLGEGMVDVILIATKKCGWKKIFYIHTNVCSSIKSLSLYIRGEIKDLYHYNICWLFVYFSGRHLFRQCRQSTRFISHSRFDPIRLLRCIFAYKCSCLV